MLVALSLWTVSAIPSASLSSFSFVAVRIPSGSLLSPSRTAAVCGGNVLTSQRIVDVVLRAFHACAASQGCTNNLTFGAGGKDSEGRNVAGWGYYEVRGSVYAYSLVNAEGPRRRLREVLGQARLGMEHQGCIHT